MSHPAQTARSIAVVLMILAIGVFGLGIWGQMAKPALDQARLDAMALEGPAAFDAVPVPFVLVPLENNWVPSIILGETATVFGVYARIGGVLGLLGLLLISLRPMPVALPDNPESDSLSRIDPPSMAQVQAEQTTEWQRRLAEKMSATSTSKAVSPKIRPGMSLWVIVMVMAGFAGLAVLAAALLLPPEATALPDMSVMLDTGIMSVRALLAGDRAMMMTAVKVIAVICAILVIIRVAGSMRQSAGQGDKLAAH
jgi:hypothetical protein